jgi:hypothetical protein
LRTFSYTHICIQQQKYIYEPKLLKMWTLKNHVHNLRSEHLNQYATRIHESFFYIAIQMQNVIIEKLEQLIIIMVRPYIVTNHERTLYYTHWSFVFFIPAKLFLIEQMFKYFDICTLVDKLEPVNNVSQWLGI